MYNLTLLRQKVGKLSIIRKSTYEEKYKTEHQIRKEWIERGGFPDLANKNAGPPDKFKFQVKIHHLG